MDFHVNECPKCGGDMGITESRKFEAGGIQTMRRRRNCKACNHRIFTVEIPHSILNAAEFDDLVAELREEGEDS